jgi:DNA-binding SARP family transcriptional activator
MSTLHISLFGKFDVRYGERRLIGLDAPKARELFCYLLLYRERSHPRESLADLLWGDHPTAQSKNYLRKALWQLQSTLDAQMESVKGQFLLIESEWIQLHPQAALWLDVTVFEQVFSLVHGIPGRDLLQEQVQVLRDAVELYRGELLEGWYQEWCLYERERFQFKYLTMLDKLMDYGEANREFEKALLYGERILRYDRARERTHRRLMRLHYLAGDRTAALRQYERCASALREELGVEPAERTLRLRDLIIADRLDNIIQAPTEVEIASNAGANPLPELLSRLKQVQEVLTHVQHQLQQQIWTVESTLSGRRSQPD